MHRLPAPFFVLATQNPLEQEGTYPLPEAPEFVHQWVNWKAGPRGMLTLVTCAKARAILHGRNHATDDDVQAVAKPALRHRVAGNYTAQAKNIGSEQLIEMLMQVVPADKHCQRPDA